jgi:succinate dehydrogenase / fumarate reductase cytochrome b subunit
MAAPLTTTPKSQNWLVQFLTSSIGRKVLMAATGLFLILFLIVHLLGNLQLLKGDGGEAFNKYAYFMGHNPLIQTISIGNFAFILLHVVVAFMLSAKNKAARPVNYVYQKQAGSSSWSSRNMLLLGSIVLIFLVVHLAQFWAKSKFGGLREVTYSGEIHGFHNLYEATVGAFSEWYWVALYVVAMIGLSYHLLHGFWSAFQTFGLQHKKYTPVIKFLGVAYAIIIPLLYAAIPVLMFAKSQGWY